MVSTNFFLYRANKPLTKPSILQDRNVPKKGDHYIRSVKFSPDSKMLATGAEDHKLRVGIRTLLPHYTLANARPRSGTSLLDKSVTFSRATQRRSTPSTFPATLGISCRAQRTRLCASGIRRRTARSRSISRTALMASRASLALRSRRTARSLLAEHSTRWFGSMISQRVRLSAHCLGTVTACTASPSRLTAGA